MPLSLCEENDILAWMSPTTRREKEERIPPGKYKDWLPLTTAFPLHSKGMLTGRDAFASDLDPKTLRVRAEAFRISKSDAAAAAVKLGATPSPHWDARDARKALLEAGDLSAFIYPYHYRPFDTRSVLYHTSVIDREERSTLKHLLDRRNRAIIAAPAPGDIPFEHAWVTNGLTDLHFFSDKAQEEAWVFPLYRISTYGTLSLGDMRNFGYDFLRALVKTMGVRCRYPDGMPKGAEPDEIFDYIYAFLHCPAYRTHHAKQLKKETPHIPIVTHLAHFKAFRDIGAQLSALHLLEAPELDSPAQAYDGPNAHAFDPKITLSPISPDVWNFRIGRRQVCAEWLAARHGRPLTPTEIRTFGRITEALRRTLILRKELDTLFASQGGWPIR